MVFKMRLILVDPDTISSKLTHGRFRLKCLYVLTNCEQKLDDQTIANVSQ